MILSPIIKELNKDIAKGLPQISQTPNYQYLILDTADGKSFFPVRVKTVGFWMVVAQQVDQAITASTAFCSSPKVGVDP